MANLASPKVLVMFLVVLLTISMNSEAHNFDPKVMESNVLSSELSSDVSKIEYKKDESGMVDWRTEYRASPGGPDPMHHGTPPPSPA
ncbi:CLAVATA3/ESR (CLE)-related protein 6 [Camellia lanceoleosa]|uniref:CLAVATA3/ESR (CLE)-related protein 6 n=1 Tax=Camellia lanceoleosa TaxID=1840588 RepID=A0ACC0H1S5_9ERIC|nr:CLAVATA3/ESR (CLE)-related protein 6 [Camellia lanceoleosa]